MPVPKHKFLFMGNTELENFARQISGERRYWLVRTMGGDYYSEFVKDNFIAIGYNFITLQDLKSLPDNETISKEILTSMFEDRMDIPSERSHYAIGQILRFYREISIGDVVIVPSRGSHSVSFGIVESSIYEDIKNQHSQDACQFSKRIQINWKTTKARGYLNPNLQLMFNSRHIISNVDGYSSYIDSLMSGFYVKEGEAHLTLRINSEDNISTGQFFAMYQIFDIVNRFCQKNGIPDRTDDIVWKIQMESPGDTRLISKSIRILGYVGITVVAIVGGGLKIDKIGLDLSTKGLIGNYNEYLDREVDRDLKMSIKSKLDSLKLETPEDFNSAIKLLETQNTTRTPY